MADTGVEIDSDLVDDINSESENLSISQSTGADAAKDMADAQLKEKLSASDLEAFKNAVIKEDPSTVPKGYEEIYKKDVASKRAAYDAINKISKTKLDYKADVTQNFDSDTPTAKENTTQVKNTAKTIQKGIDKSGKTNDEVADKIDEKAKTAKNELAAAAMSALALLIRQLPNLAKAAALGAFLQGLADGMSGCFENNYTTNSSKKLNCNTSGSTTQSDCVCPDPSGLKNDCTDFTPANTCDSGYTYVYRKYNWYDVLAGAFSAIPEIFKGIGNIFKWIENNWIGIVGVIVAVIIGIIIIKLSLKKAGE